jgi:dTDP-glucose 4,6-dehydratase/UDP-glucuronate decarboxylase
MSVAQALPQSLPDRSALKSGPLPPVLPHFPRVVRDDLPEIAQALDGHVAALSGRRVLVTGATGMLAGYLVDTLAYLNDCGALSSPCRLTLLARSPERARQRLGHLQGRADVEFVFQDVCAPISAALSADFLIHAAAPATPKDFLGDPLGSLDANTHALRNLLERARAASPASVLYMSSSEVYGTPDPDAIPTPEGYVGRVDPLSRRAYYAEAKRAGETYCRAYHEVHGLPIKIARPFHVHGPGMRLDEGRAVPTLIAMGLSGERLALESDGRATRTYGYVSDGTVALLRLLLSEHQGEAFNVGSDRPEISMLELAQHISELFGRTEPVLINRSPSSKAGQGAPGRACPDLGKLRAAFAFEPRVLLREGLSRIIRWFQPS